jgi:type VI secretion system ImpM family protein
MKNQIQWKWFVWGKHPGLEDFIWAGTQTPLFHRFTKWVDNGFARFKTDTRLRSRHCSWRFWTRGTGHQVVCGLVRNSCDAHGRSFPLLYIGAGDLEEWFNNCSMLPFAFESIWKSFEYTASARYGTIGQLNDSLQLLLAPRPEWRLYQQRIYNSVNYTKATQYAETLTDGKRLIKISCEQPENLPYNAQFCKHVMSIGDNKAPLAVFISEIDGWIAVAIINHTLTPDDFAWLWALGAENDTAGQQIGHKG